MRMNKHLFYMRIANTISEASHAERSRVGALLEKDGNIIAFGYNGMPSGFTNICEIDEGLATNPTVLHAESNAIAKCAKWGTSCENAVLYITTAPCFDCAKLIIQSGIKSVIYQQEYRLKNGLELLADAGIDTFKLEDLL